MMTCHRQAAFDRLTGRQKPTPENSLRIEPTPLFASSPLSAHVDESTVTGLAAEVVKIDHADGFGPKQVPANDDQRRPTVSRQEPATGCLLSFRGDGAVLMKCRHVRPLRVSHQPVAQDAEPRKDVLNNLLRLRCLRSFRDRIDNSRGCGSRLFGDFLSLLPSLDGLGRVRRSRLRRIFLR